MKRKHNLNLTHFAQKLRREMTKEERHLWYDFLKGLPLTIHRQKVIGIYFVDFYCASKNLVIEIDGSQHYDQEGLAVDTVRDKYLNNLELTVKRYTNTEINNSFESVCDDIYFFIYPNQE